MASWHAPVMHSKAGDLGFLLPADRTDNGRYADVGIDR